MFSEHDLELNLGFRLGTKDMVFTINRGSRKYYDNKKCFLSKIWIHQTFLY